MASIRPSDRGCRKFWIVKSIMNHLASSFTFVRYVFFPLFGGFKWFFWLFPFLWSGSSIVAMHMDIPSPNQVIKVKGVFKDTSKGVYSRTGHYSMRIVDAKGNNYSCSCEASGYFNCLSPKKSEHQRLLKLLHGKAGELWLYPDHVLFSGSNACYQISDESVIYRTFEKSVKDYTNAKSDIGVYTVWLWLILIFLVIAVRVAMFTTEPMAVK